MHLLIRRFSAFPAPDVLLGVFATVSEVEAAKALYVAAYEADPDADPWKRPGYNDQTPASHELAVEELTGEFPNGSDVFVVGNYNEWFGHVHRVFDSLHATAAAAALRAKELDAVDDAADVSPHYALVDWVRTGVLHSDAPEDQPELNWL